MTAQETSEKHLIREVFEEFLDSDRFHDKIIAYTNKTCKDFIHNALIFSVPLIGICISLILYIYLSLSTTVKDLSLATHKLDKTIGIFHSNIQGINMRMDEHIRRDK